MPGTQVEPRAARRAARGAPRGGWAAPVPGPALAQRSHACGDRPARRGRALMAELREVLRSDPHLAQLAEDDLAALADALEVEELPEGAPLVEGGAPPAALFLILSGELATRGPDGGDRRLGPGAWLGGFAGVEAAPALATASAAGPVQVGRLSQATYRLLHQGRPALRV